MGPSDILLLHEGPEGEKFGAIQSMAKGIRNIISAIKPKIVVSGAYNYSKEYQISDTKGYSLKRNEIIILDDLFK